MSLLLTQEESDRFAAWLEHEASTALGMIAQMEKINAPAPIIASFKAEAAAATLIARKLRRTERIELS